MNLPQIAHVIFNSTKVRTFTECDRITFQGTFKGAEKKQQERPQFWKVLNVYQSRRCLSAGENNIGAVHQRLR